MLGISVRTFRYTTAHKTEHIQDSRLGRVRLLRRNHYRKSFWLLLCYHGASYTIFVLQCQEATQLK